MITRFGLRPILQQHRNARPSEPAYNYIGRPGKVISPELGPEGGAVRVSLGDDDLDILAWCHEHERMSCEQSVMIMYHDDHCNSYRVRPLHSSDSGVFDIESGVHQAALID